ncbi:MAG: mshD 3 [Myxococcales bacterium]|nr:mshD 3 [Myxococcales bacterium]
MNEVAPLTLGDLDAATSLLDSVGLQGGAANLVRYLRWQPDGAWKLIDGGELVGMVTLLRQGDIGFVGCMAVRSAMQGRGLGCRLLEHAHAHGRRTGIATFLLEATAAGEPLYRKLGYTCDYESAIFARAANGVATANKIAISDHEAIRELDRMATASTRDVMLDDLVASFPGSTAGTSGLAGYGLVIGERLGPVIAVDPGAGRALIAELAPGTTVAAAPLINEASVAALVAAGFAQVRSLKRMRLGAPRAVRPAWIWTLASPGAG